MAKESAEVIEEAERRDPKHGKAWAALVDGNGTQLSLIKETAARRGVKVAIQCSTSSTLSKRLWRAAYCFG